MGCLLLGRKAMTNQDSELKCRNITLLTKACIVKAMVFPVVWMWELDHEEGWALKNWCFQTVVLEKILESPLDSKEIRPVNHKGNQSWIFTGRTDAEAPILWPPDAKNWPIGKDPDAGKDWRQEEKQMTEDEMVGWHHRLDGHEFSRSVVCDSVWPHGLQHTRLLCPSLSPRACSDSCPSSWWCHLIISSSVTLFSSCPQSFPA